MGGEGYKRWPRWGWEWEHFRLLAALKHLKQLKAEVQRTYTESGDIWPEFSISLEIGIYENLSGYMIFRIFCLFTSQPPRNRLQPKP